MSDRGNSRTAGGGWRPMAGFTWEVFCLALLWALAFGTIPVVLLQVAVDGDLNLLLWTAFWAYFVLTLKVTGWISNRYRERQRKTVMNARDLLCRDARPYVLYLRPFKDDEITSRMPNLSTEEQALAAVMHEFGPFIAFGEPGEEAPDPGAARMYVDQESWRPEVEALMSGARLIVARAGSTDSFWWEMSRAVELVGSERLLILLPDDKNARAEFRRRAAGVLPCRLPDHDFRSSRSGSSRSSISLEGFLYFEPDWTPRLVRFETFRLRYTFWAPGVSVFKAALRPVYDRFGVEWKRPPLEPALLVVAVTMLVLFGILAVYVAAKELVLLLALLRSVLG